MSLVVMSPTSQVVRRFEDVEILDAAEYKYGHPRDTKPPETLNEIIARLAEQVQQPNSYPPSLFEPLLDALAKRAPRMFEKYIQMETA